MKELQKSFAKFKKNIATDGICFGVAILAVTIIWSGNVSLALKTLNGEGSLVSWTNVLLMTSYACAVGGVIAKLVEWRTARRSAVLLPAWRWVGRRGMALLESPEQEAVVMTERSSSDRDRDHWPVPGPAGPFMRAPSAAKRRQAA